MADAAGPRVALVVVSHSAGLAQGVVEVAGQMAPDVTFAPAGGAAGGLGTDLDLVTDALRRGLAAGDVVVLTDLGSAVLTAESAVELLDEAQAARVRVVDAPLVEGAVAAAVAAQQGGDLAGVAAAAEHAGRVPPATAGTGAGPASGASGAPVDPVATGDGVTVTVVLRDAHGLHARPAAVLARTAAAQPTQVRVGGVDAASMLELMRLDAREGALLDVTAHGPDAADAVAAVVGVLEREGIASPDEAGPSAGRG